jgi:hypothetical protein
MKYFVVQESSADALTDTVNMMLEGGWKLQGGVAISSSTDQGYTRELFAQAMIKETK